MGVYTLLVVGATTALTGAAESCRSWPTCGGRWFALDSLSLAIVWGHRTAALVTGVLVVTVAVLAWYRGESRRVRAAATTAVVAYPVQVAVGAFTATNGASAALAGAHLALGVGIFAALVLALAWTLEAQTGHLPSAEWEGEPRNDDESAPPVSGPLATPYAYFRLMKPRLMWLLCLVASAGMALAASAAPSATGPALRTTTILGTLGGGVLAIGASGTFNHVLEREKDKKMARTDDRPIATDRIPIRNAIAFGLLLAAASLVAFYSVNALTAVLGLTAIVFYSVIYTLVLKPNTRQSTVIGGAAGALPALIGWAAVTGDVGVAGLALAVVIFLWTPAHFYNLALAYKDDYERGGFPLMPVVSGEATTRKHIVYYLGATLVSAVALAALTDLGALFAGTTVALGAVFLYFAVRLHRERDRSAAMRTFHASNAYLGCLLVAVVLDAMVV
ncbi:heme o synthase [Halobacterium wangiae]|uniref:heme o synthase n=1 Tax=Halobacterium wangiae TaxID=2902623 RepID=UPI001E6448C4|nr:heme o synthase [Halobacterium wangiae]